MPCGRTARAGATGDAVSFGCEEYVYSLMEIEDFIGYKIPIKNVGVELLAKPAPPVKMEKKKYKGNPNKAGKPKRRSFSRRN